MEIKIPDRSIPTKIREKYENLTADGLTNLQSGKYDEAKNLFLKIYKNLLEAQKQEERPIHKGLPLHNLGIALFHLGKPDEAVNYILCAYIEDTLNVAYDLEDDADRAPAAVVLRDIFYFRLRILREIKNKIQNIKEAGKWYSARNPETILFEVAKSLGFDPQKLTRECRRLPTRDKPLLGFPESREQRVFIGTNYNQNPIIISIIKEAVFKKGYKPVAAVDFGINKDTIHDDCLVLLHTCRYAIFDITSPGGQLMELERVHDYNIEVLLVRQTVDLALPPIVSSMVSTLGYKIEYYSNPVQLSNKVQGFLP